jgi:hypothetical protein
VPYSRRPTLDVNTTTYDVGRGHNVFTVRPSGSANIDTCRAPYTQLACDQAEGVGHVH